MAPIQTIIFDLGNTLIPFSLALLRARWGDGAAEAAELCNRLESGRMPSAMFRSRMCALTGLEDAGFDAWWNSIFEERWLIAPERIRAAKEQYRVGLLSNTNALHFDFLRRTRPLLDELDFHVLSHEVGASKPEAAMYAAAEAAAQCRPEAILYLDDVPEFVRAAHARGWQAIEFTGPGMLDEALDAALQLSGNKGTRMGS
ncbi:MAG TPA: HAD-IA family hydrolase [Terriglobales bacterium]|nr:HAD-IA family hydrolase [Terriglobales bacterium]